MSEAEHERRARHFIEAVTSDAVDRVNERLRTMGGRPMNRADTAAFRMGFTEGAMAIMERFADERLKIEDGRVIFSGEGYDA